MKTILLVRGMSSNFGNISFGNECNAFQYTCVHMRDVFYNTMEKLVLCTFLIIYIHVD